MNKKILTIANIDANDGINRFGDNEELYERFLKRFPDDDSYSKLIGYINDEDFDNATISVHTLKGVSANLSLESLRIACISLETKMKNKEYNNLQPDLKQLMFEYDKVLTAIINC